MNLLKRQIKHRGEKALLWGFFVVVIWLNVLFGQVTGRILINEEYEGNPARTPGKDRI